MSCNLSEVTVVAVAFILGTVLPILPLQILFLNLVTDVFPALALGVSKGEKNLMSQPPRNESESILTNAHWIFIAAYGGIITISVMSVLYIGLYVLNLSEMEAVTLSFLTLALAQLWHVFNMRSRESGFMDNSVVKNPFVWGALVLSFGLLMGAIFIPPVATALSVVPPDAAGWLIVGGFSLVPLVAGQIYLFLSKDGE
jgi:Ca2+-transporting ATPase